MNSDKKASFGISFGLFVGLILVFTITVNHMLDFKTLTPLAQPKQEHVTPQKQQTDDFQMHSNSLGKALLKGQ